jgi:hypothetical protein
VNIDEINQSLPLIPSLVNVIDLKNETKILQFKWKWINYCLRMDKSSSEMSVGLANNPRSTIKFRHISRNVFAIVRADVLSQRKT